MMNEYNEQLWNEIAFENGLHPDDDYDLVEELVFQELEKICE